MASFKSLQMAKELSADSRITVSKSFLGLRTTATYAPTGSKLEAFVNDYTAEDGNKLEALLNSNGEKFCEATKRCAGITAAAAGPARLEGLLSADHQFAALQLFRYSDFQYVATGAPRIFEGSEAELISTVF